MGHIKVFRLMVCMYLTLITRVYQMLKFTFILTLTFTSPFLLEIRTWVPFMLGSGNLVCYMPYRDQNKHLENSCGNLCIKILFSYGQRPKGRGICVLQKSGRPRWLGWMRRLTGDQEIAGSTPAEVGNILSWRLIMKYFLRSFSPFC